MPNISKFYQLRKTPQNFFVQKESFTLIILVFSSSKNRILQIKRMNQRKKNQVEKRKIESKWVENFHLWNQSKMFQKLII